MESPEKKEGLCGTFVSKFVLGGQCFYFTSIWKEDGFSISISDAVHVWTKAVKMDYIEQKLKPKEMEMSRYLQLTKAALTKQDTTKQFFSYKLRQGRTTSDPDLELTWRIKLGQDTDIPFSVKGTLGLESAESIKKELGNTISFLIDKKTSLTEKNKKISKENTKLRRQRDDALGQLNFIVEEKKALELDLYQKFVYILNEKKKKIRELRNEVAAAEQRAPQAVPATIPIGDSHEEYNSSRETTPERGTFSMSGPTPSLSLLEDENNYNIKTTVRKRVRPAMTKDGGGNNNMAKNKGIKDRLPEPTNTGPPKKKPKIAKITNRATNKNLAKKSNKEGQLINKHKQAQTNKPKPRNSITADDLLDMLQ